MTNTTFAEEVDLQLCGDCMLIIASDDDSGCPDPEAVREALYTRWPRPWRLIVLAASDDVNGFGSLEGESCDGCSRVELMRATGVAVRD